MVRDSRAAPAAQSPTTARRTAAAAVLLIVVGGLWACGSGHGDVRSAVRAVDNSPTADPGIDATPSSDAAQPLLSGTALTSGPLGALELTELKGPALMPANEMESFGSRPSAGWPDDVTLSDAMPGSLSSVFGVDAEAKQYADERTVDATPSTLPPWRRPHDGEPIEWHDGDRTLSVWVDPDLVLEFSEDGGTAGEVVLRSTFGVVKRVESAVGVRGSASESDSKAGTHPVFRSDTGDLMLLPGGVMVGLDPGWDDAAVEAFFSRNGITSKRRQPIEWLTNGFFVETEPGFASLTLANELAVLAGVEFSVPNWATPLETR